MISTFHSGLARRASTQTLTGGCGPGVTQLSPSAVHANKVSHVGHPDRGGQQMRLVSACFCQQAIESFQYLLCLTSGVSGGIAGDLPGGINSSRMDL